MQRTNDEDFEGMLSFVLRALLSEDGMKHGGEESDKGKWLPSRHNWSGIIDSYHSAGDFEK